MCTSTCRIDSLNRRNEPCAQSSFWNGHQCFPEIISHSTLSHSIWSPWEGQSQSEDGWRVQGVIWLVTTAAAAAMSYPTGLRGVRMWNVPLLGCRMGPNGGVYRCRWIGENHPSCEGCERGSGCENWSVERLWLVVSCEGGWCYRLAGDSYLWFGLLNLCW